MQVLSVGHGLQEHITTMGLWDVGLVAASAAIYALFRYLVSHNVLRPFAEYTRQKRVDKFVHRGFDLIHYVISLGLGIWSVSSRPYALCPWYAGGAADVLGQLPRFELSVAEKIYFVWFIVYLIVDVGYLPTGTEAVVFAVHHALTVFMMTVVVVLRAPGVCMSIMLLHDAVDVPLYGAKIADYLGFPKIRDLNFLAFFLGFAWLRITNFPIIIYHCVCALWTPLEMWWVWFATIFALLGLYALHWKWELQILRILYLTVFHGGAVDTRSD